MTKRRRPKFRANPKPSVAPGSDSVKITGESSSSPSLPSGTPTIGAQSVATAWYESNLLWGSIGLAVTFLTWGLSVSSNILLVISFLLFALFFWALFRRVASPWSSFLFIVVSSCCGLGIKWVAASISGSIDLGLRPYLTVKQMRLLGDIAPGQWIKGEVMIVNSGKTPALDARSCSTLIYRANTQQVTDDEPCPNLLAPGLAPNELISTFVLGPGMEGLSYSQRVKIEPAAQVVEFLKIRGFYLYLLGEVSYSIPGSSTRDTLKYCGAYNPTLRAFEMCAKHNSFHRGE